MQKYKNCNGFSLIEVLVVIAIIGIFATLGTQGYRSIITGADTMKAGTELVQHLNDIRFRAFSENKHYKVQIVNGKNKTTIEVYKPDDDKHKWKDIDLVRKCAWEFNGTTVADNCLDTFCNSDINSTLKVLPEKVIQKININKCINSECSETIADVVNICFLFDGTIALPEIDPHLEAGEDNNFLYLFSYNFYITLLKKVYYICVSYYPQNILRYFFLLK